MPASLRVLCGKGFAPAGGPWRTLKDIGLQGRTSNFAFEAAVCYGEDSKFRFGGMTARGTPSMSTN
jgi:hypothetical protein